MRIGIVGAGVSGLTAALKLIQAGHQITIWEKASQPGGLIAGFKDPAWDWPLEMHYHHLFHTDTQAINLAHQLKIKVFFQKPQASIWIKGHIYPFDTPQSLLKFPHLGPVDKLRTAASLTYLKLSPRWPPLESLTARKWIINYMGYRPWKILWEPLFVGKFGQDANRISATWFWARIHKRSRALGYFPGGFPHLAQKLTQTIARQGGRILLNCPVISVTPQPGTKVAVNAPQGKGIFDRVIITTTSPTLETILSPLSKPYRDRLSWLQGLGSLNLILALKSSLLPDGTYWLNINDPRFPFVTAVEHTNFIDRRHYHHDFIVYLGSYLSPHHRLYQQPKSQLIKKFLPYLQKINPRFTPDWIRKSWLFKVPFAQPLIPTYYSQILPPMTTPVPHVYWTSIQHVYPWDRGVNYAIEWGQKIADLVMSS